ncbi:MAG: DNA-3-methyladenine glycosylase I [Acidimicrobiales bacterium]
MNDVVIGDDGNARCGWGASTPDYVDYHDHEWGRPVLDRTTLFEKLCLEGFQSGLSWITILRKRENFRAAFAGFDPNLVAAFDDDDVERLLADAGIVRHQGKIRSTINNAQAVLAMEANGEQLQDLMWSHRPKTRHRPATMSEVAATTPESVALAKALKRRGFSFVGPTTAYAAMQAMGIVNDHMVGCWQREACEAAQLAVG